MRRPEGSPSTARRPVAPLRAPGIGTRTGGPALRTPTTPGRSPGHHADDGAVAVDPVDRSADDVILQVHPGPRTTLPRGRAEGEGVGVRLVDGVAHVGQRPYGDRAQRIAHRGHEPGHQL